MSDPGAATTPSTGLRRQSLRGDAADVIRAQIVSGELQPGTLYAIGQIAEQLQVSITPVREALLDLTKEGLIEMVRNRGFRVRVLTDADLDQILQIRLMLEVGAVREITAHVLVDDFTALRDLADRARKAVLADDLIGYLGIDRQLHLALLAHLDNPRLVDIVGQLRDQTRLYGLDRLAGTQVLVASIREHDELLDAVEAGRTEDAVEVMRRHLKHARGIWAGRTESKSDG
ncbi:GntR family transcriptional regulator [Saccharopolyspora pogona]|uniref:GntR family transcriptional regulator n=1 Tax=Saccharopolyspora pogona TaxID=333966 RepID=UPI001685EBDB|nr:GntR family transcriptional regulator [Saccharopolyspora pogona]